MELILSLLESSRLGEEEEEEGGDLFHRHRSHSSRPQDDDDDDRRDDRRDDAPALRGAAVVESCTALSGALRRLFVLDPPSSNGGDLPPPPPSSHSIVASASSSAAAAAAAAATAVASSSSSSSSPPVANDVASWLYDTCARLPSPLPPLQLALAVLSAICASAGGTGGAGGGAQHGDESRVQSSLFELLGEGESSIEALFGIMERIGEIRDAGVAESDLRAAAAAGSSSSSSSAAAAAERPAGGGADVLDRLDRLGRLRAGAYEAAGLVSDLRAELRSLDADDAAPPGGGGAAHTTHSVARRSDKDAEKSRKRAIRAAMNAVNAAREAGALTGDDEATLRGILDGGKADATISATTRDEEAELFRRPRGLDGMTSRELDDMRLGLLPEGTRVFDDGSLRGLPRGTIREIKEGMYERVIIPPPTLDRSNQAERINLDEALGRDTEERMAFEGASSLNPMQSAVFEMAYNTRENLLICAPTGELSF